MKIKGHRSWTAKTGKGHLCLIYVRGNVCTYIANYNTITITEK